jgi:hypothetical protein
MIKRKTQKKEDKPSTMASSTQVLIEHFDAKFDLLLDGYAMTNKKLDDFRIEINEKFTEIDDKFEIVFEELGDIRKELKSVKI